MIWVPAYFTNDKNLACNYALAGNKIVIIDEGDKDFVGVPNVMSASILLPPYESASQELDGDYFGAKMLYEQWLCTKECMDYIHLISLAIIKGIPIVLYFGPDSNEMKFPGVLLEFLYKTTGISFTNAAFPNAKGTMRKAYIPICLGRMLLCGILDIPTFIMMMPDDADIPMDVIAYLTSTLKPYMKPGANLEDYNEYFKDLIKKSKMAGRYLINPIIGVESKV